LRAQIRQFGVYGVLGRPLSYNEIIAMDAAAEIVLIYNEMNKSNDFATWSNMNPEKAEKLLSVMGLVYGENE